MYNCLEEARKARDTDTLKDFLAIIALDQESCWETLLYSVLWDLRCTPMPPCEVLAGTRIAQLIYSQAQPVLASPMKRGAAGFVSMGTSTQKFDVLGILSLLI